MTRLYFFNVFRVFLIKEMQHLSEKTQFLGFSFPSSAVSLVRRGGKINYLLIAYFFSNVCAKSYQNQLVYVRMRARQNSDILGHSLQNLDN